MSKLTATEVRGLMEAYGAVYAPQKEEQEVQELSLEIIENAAYVLFSQGYDVDDVVSYFTEATEEVIAEDFVNFSEGNVILESVAVSEEYIEEQFQQLDERIGGLLRGAAGLVGKGLSKAGKFLSNKVTPKPKPAALPPAGATGAGAKNFAAPMPQKQNLLQRAASGAKNLIKKIPGANIAAKAVKSPAGQFIKKAGSRVLPGLGVAAYGADAVDRAKKGDWGGAALSGIGAAVSAVPGAGTVASLAPAGVQMATDALGLTGDRSRKPSTAKTAPAGKPPKAGMVNTSKGMRYKSSSDAKHYKNYNDALAARRSRRGEVVPPAKPPAASKPAPSAPAAPSRPTSATPAPSKPAAVKSAPQVVGGAERRTPTSAELSAAQTARKSALEAGKSRDEAEKAAVQAGINRGTKLMGGPEGPGEIDTKSIQKDLEDFKKRTSKKVTSTTTNESYDAYDLVLDYLFETNQVESLSEAHYVMMEMSSDTIHSIVEEKLSFFLTEFEFIKESLLEEGYDLSSYEDSELVEVFISENILPALAKLIVTMNKAAKPTAAVAKTLAKGVAKGAPEFAKGFSQGLGGTARVIRSLATGKNTSSAVKALPQSKKGGALVKYQSPGSLAKSNAKPSAITKPNLDRSGALAKTSKEPAGKMVDLSVKPVTVRDIPEIPKSKSNFGTNNKSAVSSTPKPSNSPKTETTPKPSNTTNTNSTNSSKPSTELNKKKNKSNIGPGIAAGIIASRRQSEK